MVFQICFNFAILASSSFKYSSIYFCFFSSSFLSFSLLECLSVLRCLDNLPCFTFRWQMSQNTSFWLYTLLLSFCLSKHSIHILFISLNSSPFLFFLHFALSTLHTIIRYYPFNFKCISLYHKISYYLIWKFMGFKFKFLVAFFHTLCQTYSRQ